MRRQKSRRGQKRRTSSQSWSKGTIALVVSLGLVACGIFGGFFYWLYARRAAYVEVVGQVEPIERDALTDDTPTVPDFFTADHIKRYRAGEGLVVPFVVRNDPRNGYQDSTETFTLKPWPSYKEESSRQGAVRQAKKEFQEYVDRFLEYRPRKIQVYLCVDDTEGITSAIRKKVNAELKNLDLKARLEKGDTVEVFGWTLSDTEFTENQRVRLTPDTEDVDAALKPLLNWLLEEITPAQGSSLAAGISRLAKLSPNHPDREILVFSDGLENSSFADFYTKPADLDPKKFGELDKKLFGGKFPPLEKAKVNWYPPPVDANLAPSVRKALAYWEHALAKAGAKVKIN